MFGFDFGGSHALADADLEDLDNDLMTATAVALPKSPEALKPIRPRSMPESTGPRAVGQSTSKDHTNEDDMVTKSGNAGSADKDCGRPGVTPSTTSSYVMVNSLIEQKNSQGNDFILLAKVPTPGKNHARNARKKKRAKLQKAMPALKTLHGFTPFASGDEDSDYSVDGSCSGSLRDLSAGYTASMLDTRPAMRRELSGLSGSGLRSASPAGVSALTVQLEQSKLDSSATSSASPTTDTFSDEDTATTMSYEIPLETDFISQDVPEKDLETPTGEAFPRKMTAQDFTPLRCLGKGAFGTVLLVKQKTTGKLYAQKQFKKASLNMRRQLVEQTKTERAILESVNSHPFVVKLYYAFQDHSKLYLLLEYAQGGELFERMRTEHMLPESTAAFYMAEMVLALEHLHRNLGVVYRDLKPENCLLDAEGHLLLTDFGLSKVAVDGEHHCNSMLGTLEYMAPEVIMQKPYGTAVDWWSFGVLGFDLLTGGSPFVANNDGMIKTKILKSKPVMPYFLGPDAKDLLTRLLNKNPKKRLGGNMPKDMTTIKSHRFFRKIDWKKLERRELEPPIKPLITDPELAENFSEEFTGLAMSPAPTNDGWLSAAAKDNPFGGFSFVASASVLEDQWRWF